MDDISSLLGYSANRDDGRIEAGLLNSFSSMALLSLLKVYLSQAADPQSARDYLIESWKKTVWVKFNEDIKRHTHMVESTDVGKSLKQSGILLDSEALRIDLVKRVNSVALQLKNALTVNPENPDKV